MQNASAYSRVLQQSYNTIPFETAKIGFAPRSVLKVLRQSSGTFVNLHAETPSEKHDECLPDAKTLPSYSRKQTHAAFGCILQPLLFVRGTPNAGAEAARVPGERSSVLGFFGVFRVRDCGCLLILMCSSEGLLQRHLRCRMCLQWFSHALRCSKLVLRFRVLYSTSSHRP